MNNAIKNNIDRQRYEMEFDSQIVFANYHREDLKLYILHVEAPVVLRGTGAAGKLMQGIVEVAKEEHLEIIPVCGYAAAWLRRNTAII